MRWLIPMLLAGCSVSSAQQPPCMPYEAFSAVLEERFQESSHSAGLATSGSVVTVWTSPNGDTWSLTSTTPDKTTCLIGAGTDWFDYEAKVEGQSL